MFGKQTLGPVLRVRFRALAFRCRPVVVGLGLVYSLRLKLETEYTNIYTCVYIYIYTHIYIYGSYSVE